MCFGLVSPLTTVIVYYGEEADKLDKKHFTSNRESTRNYFTESISLELDLSVRATSFNHGPGVANSNHCVQMVRVAGLPYLVEGRIRLSAPGNSFHVCERRTLQRKTEVSLLRLGRWAEKDTE